MPYSLAFPFKPKYTVLRTATESANGFTVNTVKWEGQASVRVQEALAHKIKVGFIQVVKAYSIRGDYTNTIVEWKLPSTPMCDCEPATDAPWYEPNHTDPKHPVGYSPEVVGPINEIVKPYMMDRPSVEFLWQLAAGNTISQLRRKQSFQTWLVVNDQTAVPPTWQTLYCFSYSIDQYVSVDVTKAVGQRCKVEVGQSTQAQYPTPYETPPFPKIPAQAFIKKCPNTSQTSVMTPRLH